VTHNLELAVIIHALNMWRHYLLGRRFVLISDNSGLRYLFDQLNLNARQDKWLVKVNEFSSRLCKLRDRRTWLHILLA